ncbi:EscU/YscU/HrcU family type III secretion system export apparatus switch protein [Shewanella marina]|uniref:EscU/YscU/HrcU family type III secretion system export apparatus switch protein n=1 Tax=Shewanella marina TaxID=487319 RepID=UPI000ACED22D|nr:EscU/YscU/HrcU family type III secretion system export apparatus switch protein [Shewanella marina]
MKPTKHAAALTYNGTGAPYLSAKGQAQVAEDIIAIAQAAGIQIHHDPHLSQFLQFLELGEEIPPELYKLIAELLSFIYILEGKTPKNWQNPNTDVTI